MKNAKRMNQKRYSTYDLTGIAVLVFATWFSVQTCNHKNEVVAVREEQLNQKSDTIKVLQAQAATATQAASAALKTVEEVKSYTEKRFDSVVNSSQKPEQKTLLGVVDTDKEALRLQLAFVTRQRDSLAGSAFQYTNPYFKVNQVKGTDKNNNKDSFSYNYNAVLTPSLSFSGHHFFGLPKWDTAQNKKGSKNYATITLTSPDENLTFYPSGKRSYRIDLQQPDFGGAFQITSSFNGVSGAVNFGGGVRLYWRDWNAYFAYYYNVRSLRFAPAPTISISRNLFKF